MNPKKMTMLLSIFVIVFIVGYVLNSYQILGNANKNTQIQNNQDSTPSTNSNQNNGQGQGIKLSETRYWNYAYLISDDNLDSQAKASLSGFERKREILPDGFIKISLKALSTSYNDQVYTLKPGQKLYFIETSWGDDPQFKEYNLGDDVAVKVDSNGYVVK